MPENAGHLEELTFGATQRNLIAMASNLLVMASNLRAMASNHYFKGFLTLIRVERPHHDQIRLS